MPAAFDLMAAAFDSIAAVFDPNTAALNQMPQNKFIPQHLLFALHTLKIATLFGPTRFIGPKVQGFKSQVLLPKQLQVPNRQHIRVKS